MTKKEINKEANQIIKDIFGTLLKIDNKDKWKGAIDFIQEKLLILRSKGDSRKFHWEQVLRIMTNNFGKKFIRK